jgi:catechol 2,3-dioxygenase-like lactoylglutathione lyase family enzyme
MVDTEVPNDEGRPRFADPQVNLYVVDLESSLRFYREVLGFTETFRTPKEGAPDHVELRLGSWKLGLATFEALRRDHGVRTDRGPPRGEVVLWVEEVDAAYAWLRGRGVPSLSPPHDFAGTLRAAWVADPEGNPVQLVCRRVRA